MENLLSAMKYIDLARKETIDLRLSILEQKNINIWTTFLLDIIISLYNVKVADLINTIHDGSGHLDFQVSKNIHKNINKEEMQV